MKVSGFLWDDCDFSCDYDLLKELGIDIPYLAYDDKTTQGGRQKTLRGLNTAKDNDMQIIVTGWRYWSLFQNQTSSGMTQSTPILTHDSLYALYLWDEPTLERYGEVKTLTTRTRQKIQELNSDVKIYVNLLPNYATDKQLGINRENGEDYHYYVDTFVQLSDVVSGDYFFVRNYNNKTEISTKEHFPNSEITTENLYIFLRELFDASKKYNKPLWLWMVTAQHNQFAYLDDISMRLQFNIGYIVGAELMQFWTVRSAIPEEIFGGTYDYDAAPILRDYTKGESFEMVKTYLHEIAPKLNEIFDKCTVIDFGKVDDITTTIDEEVPFDSGSNHIYWNKMIDKANINYWTVMNFNDTNNIIVRVDNNYVFYNKDFVEELVEGPYKEVELIPGELLVIKNALSEIPIDETPITEITLSSNGFNVTLDETYGLIANVHPEDTTDDKIINWTIENTQIINFVNNNVTESGMLIVLKAKNIGSTNITATSSNGISKTITCVVDPIQVQSITWNETTSSSKKGKNINFPDITIQYSNGRSEIIAGNASGVTHNPEITSLSNIGEYSIKATYEGKTTQIPLIYTIEVDNVVSIEWKTTSASSIKGQQIILPMLKLYYESGDIKYINAISGDVIISPSISLNTEIGTYSINATYDGKTTQTPLTYIIRKDELVSIEWETTSTSSIEGQQVAYPRLKLYYESGDIKYIKATINDVTLSPSITSNSEPGEYSINATYDGITTQTALTYIVEPDELALIAWESISGSSTQGEQIVLPRLKLYYESGDIKYIDALSNDIVLSPIIESNSEPGKYSIIAIYEDKSTQAPLNYIILEQISEPTGSTEPTGSEEPVVEPTGASEPTGSEEPVVEPTGTSEPTKPIKIVIYVKKKVKNLTKYFMNIIKQLFK